LHSRQFAENEERAAQKKTLAQFLLGMNDVLKVSWFRTKTGPNNTIFHLFCTIARPILHVSKQQAFKAFQIRTNPGQGAISLPSTFNLDLGISNSGWLIMASTASVAR